MPFNEYIKNSNSNLNERDDLEYSKRCSKYEDTIIRNFKNSGVRWDSPTREAVYKYFTAIDQLNNVIEYLEKTHKDFKIAERQIGSEWTSGTGAEDMTDDISKILKTLNNLSKYADRVVSRFTKPGD